MGIEKFEGISWESVGQKIDEKNVERVKLCSKEKQKPRH